MQASIPAAELEAATVIPFPHGTEWLRADFHLHTRADKEFSYSGDDNQFVTRYVEMLKEQGIRVGVITNHNKFDYGEFKGLRKKARKEGIYLLPGVELSVNDGANGVHTLVVFSDQWIEDGRDYINQFLANAFSGRTPAEYEHENGRSNDNILETLKKLEAFHKDFFIVFAHVEANSGLWKEIDGGRLEELAKSPLVQKYCLGFQKVRTHNKPATQDIVMTSDAPKGQLLDLVFSEEDKVRETDEFASLEAFRQLLTDDQLRSAIRRKVEELKSHPAIHKRFIAAGKMPTRFDGAVESFFDRSRRIDSEFTGYYEQLRGIVVREDIDEMRAVSRTHRTLGKRFIELRDKVAPSPRDRRLQGVGIVIPGTSLKPHPTADIRFPAALAKRAKVAPSVDGVGDEADAEAFEREMRRQSYVAHEQLKLRIALARMKSGRAEVQLSQVLQLFPLKFGLFELNAFIELAVQHLPSRFDPDLIAVTRLTDEYEDPLGQRTCTFFDPVFLDDGEPGQGIEAISCRLPDDSRIDTEAWAALEEDGVKARVQQLIGRATPSQPSHNGAGPHHAGEPLVQG